jgi:hypothetical protein
MRGTFDFLDDVLRRKHPGKVPTTISYFLKHEFPVPPTLDRASPA